MFALQLKNVSKIYEEGPGQVVALNNVSLSVKARTWPGRRVK